MSPIRRPLRASCCAAQPSSASRSREHVAAEDVDRDVLVIACGPWSPELAATVGVDLPIRPLCRQLLETVAASPTCPDDLPMVIEVETGFHFRRRGDRLRARHGRSRRRAGRSTRRSTNRSFPDRLERLARRYPPAAGATIEQSWAGLYDMTRMRTRSSAASPTASTRPADSRVTASCSRPLSAVPSPSRSSPATSSLDLSPYALERFEHGAAFPERLVL